MSKSCDPSHSKFHFSCAPCTMDESPWVHDAPAIPAKRKSCPFVSWNLGMTFSKVTFSTFFRILWTFSFTLTNQGTACRHRLGEARGVTQETCFCVDFFCDQRIEPMSQRQKTFLNVFSEWNLNICIFSRWACASVVAVSVPLALSQVGLELPLASKVVCGISLFFNIASNLCFKKTSFNDPHRCRNPQGARTPQFGKRVHSAERCGWQCLGYCGLCVAELTSYRKSQKCGNLRAGNILTSLTGLALLVPYICWVLQLILRRSA